MLKRTFDRDFKRMVVRQLISGEKRLAQLSREHNIADTIIRRWRAQYEHEGENAWLEPAEGQISSTESQSLARIAQLEAALGRAHLEIEFLRWSLEKRGSQPGRKGSS